MQGAFAGPQAAQQQQVPYGANMGYSHQPNYYNNYGVSNAYGAGFQQPAAGYSGYGVGFSAHLQCRTFKENRSCCALESTATPELLHSAQGVLHRADQCSTHNTAGYACRECCPHQT